MHLHVAAKYRVAMKTDCLQLHRTRWTFAFIVAAFVFFISGTANAQVGCLQTARGVLCETGQVVWGSGSNARCLDSDDLADTCPAPGVANCATATCQCSSPNVTCDGNCQVPSPLSSEACTDPAGQGRVASVNSCGECVATSTCADSTQVQCDDGCQNPADECLAGANRTYNACDGCGGCASGFSNCASGGGFDCQSATRPQDGTCDAPLVWDACSRTCSNYVQVSPATPQPGYVHVRDDVRLSQGNLRLEGTGMGQGDIVLNSGKALQLEGGVDDIARLNIGSWEGRQAQLVLHSSDAAQISEIVLSHGAGTFDDTSRFSLGLRPSSNFEIWRNNEGWGTTPIFGINYGTGNVGIGTENPAAALEVRGPAGSVFDIVKTAGLQTDPILRIFGNTSGGVPDQERLRILRSGNVGIGTVAPAQKLVVSDGSNNNIEFVPGGTSIIQGYNRGTDTYLPLRFDTNRSGTMFLSTAGNVGIGTTTPEGLLQINQGSGLKAQQWSFASEPGVYNLSLRPVDEGESMVRWDFVQRNVNRDSNVLTFRDGNVGVGITNPASRFSVGLTDTSTNQVANLLRLEHDTSGAVAAGFGTGISFWNERVGVGDVVQMGQIDSAAGVDDGSRFAIRTRVSPGTLTEILNINEGGNVGIARDLAVTGALTAGSATVGGVDVATLAPRPRACTATQFQRWNGTVWECVDLPTPTGVAGITGLTQGDGITVTGTGATRTIAVTDDVIRESRTYADPIWLTSLAWSKITGFGGGRCAPGQFMNRLDPNGDITCDVIPAPDLSSTLTGLTAGAGIAITGTGQTREISVADTVITSPAGCSTDEVLRFDGEAWECADLPAPLTLHNDLTGRDVADAHPQYYLQTGDTRELSVGGGLTAGTYWDTAPAVDRFAPPRVLSAGQNLLYGVVNTTSTGGNALLLQRASDDYTTVANLLQLDEQGNLTLRGGLTIRSGGLAVEAGNITIAPGATVGGVDLTNVIQTPGTCDPGQILQRVGSGWECTDIPESGIQEIAEGRAGGVRVESDGRNRAVSIMACPDPAQMLMWDGSAWQCTSDLRPIGAVTQPTGCDAAEMLIWDGSAWQCTNNLALAGAVTRPAACDPGELLQWDGSNWLCTDRFETAVIPAGACSEGQILQRSAADQSWQCSSGFVSREVDPDFRGWWNEGSPTLTNLTVEGGLSVTGTFNGVPVADLLRGTTTLPWESIAGKPGCPDGFFLNDLDDNDDVAGGGLRCVALPTDMIRATGGTPGTIPLFLAAAQELGNSPLTVTGTAVRASGDVAIGGALTVAGITRTNTILSLGAPLSVNEILIGDENDTVRFPGNVNIGESLNAGRIQGNFLASNGAPCAEGQILQRTATGWACTGLPALPAPPDLSPYYRQTGDDRDLNVGGLLRVAGATASFNGSVGVGIDTPEERLHVSGGNARVDGNLLTSGALRMGNGQSIQANGTGNTGLNIGNYAADASNFGLTLRAGERGIADLIFRQAINDSGTVVDNDLWSISLRPPTEVVDRDGRIGFTGGNLEIWRAFEGGWGTEPILSFNYNTEDVGITRGLNVGTRITTRDLTVEGAFQVNGLLQLARLDADPIGRDAGALYFNTNPDPSVGGLRVYNGSAWEAAGGAGGTGTANTLAQFNLDGTLGNSPLVLDGGTLRVGTAGTSVSVAVTGNVSATGCVGPVFASANLGAASQGNPGNYAAANELCPAGTHVCTTAEALTTINCGSVASFAPGLDEVLWISNGAPSLPTPTNDCRGWNSNGTRSFGIVWRYQVGGGEFLAEACNNAHQFACCR